MEKAFTIQLNGEKRTLTDTKTLADLLRSLAIPRERVVVEHNMTIVPREELTNTQLKDGDRVEIVHFVGGGSPTARPAADGGGFSESRGTRRTSGGATALVIVESPAKSKTINKYLGPNYEVAASMGHVIDLPKSKMGIDIENNFEPRYIVVKDKKKTLSELKKKAKNKKEIFLACDPDREGEAISWHLQNQLGKGKKVSRVVFNEITKSAVLDAFKHPKQVNMSLVSAQQARRILDRLVGYSLSPLLWQKVGRGLSAGRVQSVALRIIVDREREIKAFVPEEYWTIEADLKKKKGDPKQFIAKLEKKNDEKIEVKEGKSAQAIYDSLKGATYTVKDIRTQKKRRNPYPPFTTSKLQQAAYNVLRFPAAKTMRVAQSLYEGVELGNEGTVGLITYMRTDSVRVAESAVKEAREYILETYGKEYLPSNPNFYRGKKNAQEAHEAVRPSSVARSPQSIESFLTPDQYKLYSLIWRQMLSSQMTPAQVSQDSIDIQAGDCIFKATGSRIEFQGYLAVRARDEEDDESPLPALEVGELLDLIKLENHQHFTKPPARFTDASLVKALEEKGIGRPSTYAPIISTITDRDYVRREGGSLLPTELGMLVTDLLVKYFDKVMDFEFTANMEEELDRVEDGEKEWVDVVRQFYGVFSGQMDYAKTTMQTVKKENEPTDEICDKCSKPMVIKWGRRGRFISCSGWPECKNAKSISTDVVCPQCQQGKLVQRRAKSGRGRSFYGCTRYPECTFIVNRLPKAGDDKKPSDAASSNTPLDNVADG